MVSDVIMPGMDGYELASLVQEKYPAVKIQLTSGYAETTRLDMREDSLYRNLLYKPYDAQNLHKNIRELLGGKASFGSK